MTKTLWHVVLMGEWYTKPLLTDEDCTYDEALLEAYRKYGEDKVVVIQEEGPVEVKTDP